MSKTNNFNEFIKNEVSEFAGVRVTTNVNYLATLCNIIASKKGFNDEKIEFGTRLMLIVSELSEAIEAHRTSKRADIKIFLKDCEDLYNLIDEKLVTCNEEENRIKRHIFSMCFEKHIRGTVEEELIDTLIRLLHLLAVEKTDIDKIVSYKLYYNTLREPKHNKLY